MGFARPQLLLLLLLVPAAFPLLRVRNNPTHTALRIAVAALVLASLSGPMLDLTEKGMDLIVLVGLWVYVLSVVATDDTRSISSYHVPPLLLAPPWLAWLTTLLTFGLPYSALRMWQKNSQPPARRVHTLLVTLAAFSFVWFMSYWHLLSF